MLESFERVISGANRGPKRASINVSPHPLWNGNRESFAKSSCLESFSRLTNPSDGLVYLNVTVVPRKRCESGCNVSSTNAEFNFETREQVWRSVCVLNGLVDTLVWGLNEIFWNRSFQN